MNKRVLFYSSVKSKDLFQTQKFYQIDIEILKELGYHIILSNKITDALKFWNYNIVFAYFFRYSFFIGLIARLFNKKIFITGGIDDLEENYATPKRYKIQKLFFNLCYKVSTSCIIVSNTDYKNIIRLSPKKNWKKLQISEHSIDIKKFYDTNEKKNHFVTIGWLGNSGAIQRKGIDTSVKIFSELKKLPKFRDYKFLIIGRNGDGLNYLKEIIRKSEFASDIILTGEINEEEKIKYLKESKYYLQPSLFEGFGIAALEAWAAGNILIHSNKGGLKNPAYSTRSIIFSLDEPFEISIKNLISDIQTFKYNTELSQTQLEYYDNKRRLQDIKKILK